MSLIVVDSRTRTGSRGKGEQMSLDRHLAEIAREFPDWTIWRSDAGRWWATRHHPISSEDREAGLAMTIDADTPEGLRELLIDQRERAAGGRQDPDP
jgi:hypothetical protein